MDKCPISGDSCPYLKTISIVDIEDGKASNQVKVCYSCIGDCMEKELPIKEKKSGLFKLILKKPLVADVKEVKENIRSRSAKLRYAIRDSNSFFYPNEFKNRFLNYIKLESGGI